MSVQDREKELRDHRQESTRSRQQGSSNVPLRIGLDIAFANAQSKTSVWTDFKTSVAMYVGTLLDCEHEMHQ